MSCVGFDGTDFAIKIEAKGNLKNSPKSQIFCMTCGGVFTLSAFVCVLSNICSH